MTSAIHGRFRLSAHLGYLFQEVPFAARFAAASRAGFRAIEVADPYSFSSDEFRSLCEQSDLKVAQIVAPNGMSGAARKGLAALPGREAEFQQSLMQAIAFAKAVNCQAIHPMSGINASGQEHPQWDVYLSNVSRACSAAGDEGISVIIEPISMYGVRDYFMNSLQLASDVIDAVNAPNLLLSLDTYHACAMGADLPSFIIENAARIGHLQVADWPRRDEPGSGEVDFAAIFSALRAGGYKGYVGMEYIPSSTDFEWTLAFKDYLEPLRKSSDGGRPC